MDQNGITNCDHDIHIRAQQAAETVARKRGWTTAADIHERGIGQVRRDCHDILLSMPKWNLKVYFSRLEEKGYDVKVTKDSTGVPRGYTVKCSNTCYKASAIERKLTLRYLEETWKKLRKKEAEKAAKQPQKPVVKPSASTSGAKPFTSAQAKPFTPAPTKPTWHRPTYDNPLPVRVPFAIPTGNGAYRTYHIPEAVMNLFQNEFDERDYANADDLLLNVVRLFVGIIDAATSIQPSAGGGNSPDQSPCTTAATKKKS